MNYIQDPIINTCLEKDCVDSEISEFNQIDCILLFFCTHFERLGDALARLHTQGQK